LSFNVVIGLSCFGLFFKSPQPLAPCPKPIGYFKATLLAMPFTVTAFRKTGYHKQSNLYQVLDPGEKVFS